MPVGIGGIGDIIALQKIVQGFAAALDGSRGAAAEYQEVKRELEGLEAALRCHQQLLQARRDDPALNAIFRLTQSTAEDCQKCIEAFSQQTVKFDRSLEVGKAEIFCKDVTMKVRWQLSKKDEVVRFRTALAQHISTLNMLLGLANINLQRITTDDINSKINALEEKIDSNADAEAGSATKLREHVDEGNNQLVVTVKGVQEELRLGWLGNCLSELKEMVSQIFITTGTTFSATQRIEMIPLSRSQKALVRTFTFEDALGRITQWDLVYISSWDALDAMIEICFRDLPGHEKVARKEYVFQDERTNREIKRSTPWSGALLPDQHVNMGLLFRKQSSKNKRLWCPYCHLELEQSQEGLIPCKCGMSHQRRTETVDINEEEDMPAFDLFDAPSSDPDDLHERPDEDATSMVLGQDEKAANSTKPQEDMSVFKRVIVVEVKLNIIIRSTSWEPHHKHGQSQTWSSPNPRVTQSYRASYGDSDEDELINIDGDIYIIPGGRRTKAAYYRRSRETNHYYAQGFTYDRDGTPVIIAEPTPRHTETTPRRSRRASASTPQRPSTANRPSSSSKKQPPSIGKATEADARAHHIPAGYSLKNWDPTEEPIMLLGSVFDANSLGKWIYDWTVYRHGPATPISDVAGELWLLLIQLAGKVKRSEECMPRIRSEDNRLMINDFIESGERLVYKLKKLLKACEGPMLKVGKRLGSKEPPLLGKNSGVEFVDSIFGRDRQLDHTEKFMASIRLWNLRFDANCEHILLCPGAIKEIEQLGYMCDIYVF